jgi:hypothetical protein
MKWLAGGIPPYVCSQGVLQCTSQTLPDLLSSPAALTQTRSLKQRPLLAGHHLLAGARVTLNVTNQPEPKYVWLPFFGLTGQSQAEGCQAPGIAHMGWAPP